jgi:RNA polymerase sigma-70 factor, ECF subfamily
MADTDPAHFVRLLLQHQNALLRYILPLVGHLADAQDVLQETAVALWEKFADFDPDRPFLPWARQFARNEVLMHHRRRRRYTFLSEELIDTLAAHQADQEAAAEQRLGALAACLDALPEADRALLEERYGDSGATIQRLAGATGQTPNVLYKALARIRRRLLNCIAGRLAAAGV